jgi:hypothetical protein
MSALLFRFTYPSLKHKLNKSEITFGLVALPLCTAWLPRQEARGGIIADERKPVNAQAHKVQRWTSPQRNHQ